MQPKNLEDLSTIAIICHLWYIIRMEFRELLQIVGDEPVFETGLLLAGPVDPTDVRRQLSRWTASGRLIQLRRGLYALASPYQKTRPHPFLIAGRMVRGSYVSLQSALAHSGLVPEYVPVTTSVTTARPSRWETQLGVYAFRHIKVDLFYGYQRIDLGGGQHAYVASPEKALLDLIYLQPGGDQLPYLEGLRLQGLDRLNRDELHRLAGLACSPKLLRAAVLIDRLARVEVAEYRTL